MDLVGPSRAKFILMSGIDLDAARAAEIGLVDEVHDDVDGAVAELAATLAARSGVTQRAVKLTVDRILDGVSTDDDDARGAARGRPRLPRLRRGRPRLPRAPLPQVRVSAVTFQPRTRGRVSSLRSAPRA